MRTMITEVLNNAVFTNKNTFYQFGGHAPELIQDSRLSRSGWLAYASTLSADMYGEGLYGHSLYGEIVLAGAALVCEFDAGRLVSFDTLGLANHNVSFLDVKIEWGTSPGSYPNSAIIGPETVTNEDVYRVFLSVPSSGRYIKITFTNPTESGILRLGRLMLGLNYALPGYRTVYDSAIPSSSLAEFSSTRQLYGTRKTTWRRLAFEFAPGDNRAVLQGLMKTLDRATATLWDFDEGCMTEEVIYAHIQDSEMSLVHDEARLYSGRIVLEEVR